MTRAAVWLRVSDAGQHGTPRTSCLIWKPGPSVVGLEVVQVYQLQESAWRGGHQKVLTQVYQDARRSKYQVLLVWALDPLSREGPLAILEIVHQLLPKINPSWRLRLLMTPSYGPARRSHLN